ncbi:MAG: APC family permease [Chloroflexi bacterium]|nr:MAG: APC family permease [Chloroflexota bacterium]
MRGGRARRKEFDKVAEGYLQAKEESVKPTTQLGRLRRALLGRPLASKQQIHERLTKVKALAVLCSDALSSVAYATEQILLVLGAAGAAAYSYSMPIMVAILVLLIAVGLSYRQTIKAYPKGGGSYIVASDNLGPLAGVVAGSALMTDYVLTVAVSVASGVDSIVSAASAMQAYRVELCVAFVAILIVGNLRGIRESGSIFAAPTYLFIGGILLMLLVTGLRWGTGNVHEATPMLGKATQQVSIFLILRAFASGCTALTGVEAISDGVPAFKPPEWVNARTTLTTMGVLLGVMFLGITLVTHGLGVVPEDSTRPGYETVISQLAHSAFGSGLAYLYIAITTTGILVLAGNTAFSDFPRLLFFMARDDFAPHQFKRLGDRLAYSNGIVLLAALAILLLIGFHGDVSRLIPLYAVGVFTAFTMSQAGMVARWLRLREQGWQRGLPLNILGTVTCATVLLVTGGSNLTRGAWIIVVIVPLLVLTCRSVNRHYREVGSYVANETPMAPGDVHPVCVVPIAELNSVALQSLALARGISDTVIAVHVSDSAQEIADLRARWQVWGNRVPLEIIDSPYRSLVRPLLTYVAAIQRQRHDATVVVVLPELVATRWWHQVLHNQSALRLKAALLFRPGIVTVNVPYHLRSPEQQRHRAHHEDEAL